MSRLTIRTEKGAALKLNNPQNEIEARKQLHDKYLIAIEKLAHYEDLEEQGRLIELPCAIGNTVYVFGKFHHGIEEEKVKELRITEDCIRVMADPWDGEICEAHQIGKTVKSDYETNGYYLSITEAAEAKQAWEEAKLKELEGDKE